MDLNLKGKNAFVGGSSKGKRRAAAFQWQNWGPVNFNGRDGPALVQCLIGISFIGNGDQRHDFVAIDFGDTEK